MARHSAAGDVAAGARLALVSFIVLALSSVPAPAAEKLPAGWTEYVHLYPGKVELSAKLDTGADNSSLDAKALKQFVRSGQAWVEFEVSDRFGKTKKFELKAVRIAKIRRHGGKVEERPVVMLGICLGQVYYEAEVNLVDRSGLDHPMLIGRSFMSSRVVVDPSQTYVLSPACNI